MIVKKYKEFSEGLAISDNNLPVMERTKKLNDEEFLNKLKENCKNFSFSNDLLWRNKVKKHDLEIFEPNYRNAAPLAFPNFFNKIENDPNFPVIRKKSLIGGTDPMNVKFLVGYDNYLVIPFDNSQIVFCPIIDLWGLDDERRKSRELVKGEPISERNFIMKNYTKGFKIPKEELSKLPKANIEKGFEFFTSSPCLLIHHSKMAWLKKELGF